MSENHNGEEMISRGNSIIKGIKPETIVKLLNKAYADEWLAYYQYFIEAKVIKGFMRDSAVGELTQHANDELKHANMVADRIIQLGGTPLLNPQQWFTFSNCRYEEPKNFDASSIIKDAIKGEQCAISTYSKLADLVKDKDTVTYDIVSQILADEVEHEADLQVLNDDITEFIQKIKISIK